MNSFEANRAIIFFSLGKKYKENYISHEERLLLDHLNKSFVRHLSLIIYYSNCSKGKKKAPRNEHFFLRDHLRQKVVSAVPYITACVAKLLC